MNFKIGNKIVYDEKSLVAILEIFVNYQYLDDRNKKIDKFYNISKNIKKNVSLNETAIYSCNQMDLNGAMPHYIANTIFVSDRFEKFLNMSYPEFNYFNVVNILYENNLRSSQNKEYEKYLLKIDKFLLRFFDSSSFIFNSLSPTSYHKFNNALGGVSRDYSKLFSPINNSKKIKYISHHHEQAASFAAECYARTKKSPGCCLVTTGPGGTNTLTGVACAWIDSIPVIFISGQVFLNQTIQKTKKRQVGVQEIDIISMVKSSTKFSKMILDANSIGYYLEKAYQISITGRPGPVWIDIPADIQNAFIDESKIKKYQPKKNKIKKIDHLVKIITEKLKQSNKPLIHLGGGVRLSNSKDILKKFFKKNKIPFMLTWNADDIFSHTHDLYAGKAGAFGERGSNFIVQNCDFYLSIGSRLPYMVTGYNAKDFARKVAFGLTDETSSLSLEDQRKLI